MNYDRVHAWTILKKYQSSAPPLQKLVLQLYKLLPNKRTLKKQNYEQILDQFRIQYFNKFVFDHQTVASGSKVDLFISCIRVFDTLEIKHRKHFAELFGELLSFKEDWPGGHSGGTPLLVYWNEDLSFQSPHYESIWYKDEVKQIRDEMHLTGPMTLLAEPECPATMGPVQLDKHSEYLEKTAVFALPKVPAFISELSNKVVKMYMCGFENPTAALQDIVHSSMGNPDTQKYMETQRHNNTLSAQLKKVREELRHQKSMYHECQITLERNTQRELYEIQSRNAYIDRMTQDFRTLSQKYQHLQVQLINAKRVEYNARPPPMPPPPGYAPPGYTVPSQNSPRVSYNRSY